MHVFLRLHYRHLSSNKKDYAVKIWILISKFPSVLFGYEVSFNVNNYKICNFWEQTKQMLRGILEIIESEEWWIFEEND